MKSSVHKILAAYTHKAKGLGGNEDGFVLVTSLMVLLILVVIGVAATTNTTIELQIAGNDRIAKETFYGAESGWQVATAWLDSQYPLPTQDMGSDNSSGNLTFTTGSKYSDPDSLFFDGGASYKSTFEFNSATNVPGYSTDFKRFDYDISSNATGAAGAKAGIAVNAGKIEYVGGY